MTTELQARAEVVGYPEPVLDAIREVIRWVDDEPAAALTSGQMMSVMGEMFPDDDSSKLFMVAIANLLTVAAQVALSKETI